jgi:hypothetical protein
MLFVTQKLSLWTILFTKQSLTASHDSASAWTGLGVAIRTVYRQTSIPSALWSTIAIMLYLAGISILHITTPSLFGMQVVNTTREIQNWAYSFSDLEKLGMLLLFDPVGL